MRITRVVLAFFSVGFLAGSFERAAGLGYVPPGQGAPPYVAAAYIAPKAVLPSEPDAASGRGETIAVVDTAPTGKPLRQRALVHFEGPDIAAEDAAEGPIDADASYPDLRMPVLEPTTPMSMPSRAAWSPIPEPTYISRPQRDGTLMSDAPASQLAEALRPGREPVAAAAPEFIMPFERGRVTSLFNQGRRHPAIDLAGRLGTPVHATTRKQTVTFAGWRGGYGRLVIARDAEGRHHYYAHLQRILVRVGTRLDQGQRLGLLGSTGRSTGPHVHYEVRIRTGRRLNPATLLFPGRRVRKGFAWNGSHSVARFAARSDRARVR